MIKYMIMDVDGTLTDGKIYMGNDGEVMKAFNVKDGYAIHKVLPSNGIVPIIITGRTSKILGRRCMELGITEVMQGVEDKELAIINKFREKDLKQMAIIGDDLNDYSAMVTIKESGGVVGCPADAVLEVRKISDFISTKNGGEGAVREFIDWIISRKSTQ